MTVVPTNRDGQANAAAKDRLDLQDREVWKKIYFLATTINSQGLNAKFHRRSDSCSTAKTIKLRKSEKINKTLTMTTQTPQNALPKRSRGRPKGYEPFSQQSDSKCSSTLSALNKLIDERAGGDATGLILAYLQSRHAKSHFDYRQFDRSFELSRINKLISGFKNIYDSTPDYNKVQVSSIFRNAGITRKELKERNISISSTSWANAGKHLRELGAGVPRPAQPRRGISSDVIKQIREYFYSDEITTASSYRTVIKSVKNPAAPKEFLRDADGNIVKEIVPVRFLHNISRSFAWDKFHKENPDAAIKKSKFFQLIPQEVKNGNRETDKCPVCYYGKKIIKELTTLEKQIHSECLNCDTANCHVEDAIAEDIKNELATLRANKEVYSQHASDKDRQRNTCNNQIRSLELGEALAILDFKSNLKVNQHNVQLNHEFYQQHSRSLLGLTLVLPNQVCKDQGIHNYVYFDFLSDNLNHNAHFVITALKTFLGHEFVKDLGLSKISFWMDGAGHFKNGHLAKFLSDIESEYHISTNWNHYTEYHGKSLCDSRFSTITQWIKTELQSENGSIETTDDLIRVIQQGQLKSNSVRQLNKQQPIKSFQINIEIPDINEIDSYVIKNIKTFHCFRAVQGVIKCSVYSTDSAEVEQPRKIECVSLSTVSRRGYQTQQFDVDNLFNGLVDKQRKQNHFHGGGCLRKAPTSKRRSKTRDTTRGSASQPVPETEALYNDIDYYSQGSAISDDEMPIDNEQSQPEISNQFSNTEPSTAVDSSQYETIIHAPSDIEIFQSPLFQQVQELVTSGQITDLNSYLSTLFTSILANVSPNLSLNNTNVSAGPLTRILSRVK